MTFRSCSTFSCFMAVCVVCNEHYAGTRLLFATMALVRPRNILTYGLSSSHSDLPIITQDKSCIAYNREGRQMLLLLSQRQSGSHMNCSMIEVQTPICYFSPQVGQMRASVTPRTAESASSHRRSLMARASQASSGVLVTVPDRQLFARPEFWRMQGVEFKAPRSFIAAWSTRMSARRIMQPEMLGTLAASGRDVR